MNRTFRIAVLFTVLFTAMTASAACPLQIEVENLGNGRYILSLPSSYPIIVGEEWEFIETNKTGGLDVGVAAPKGLKFVFGDSSKVAAVRIQKSEVRAAILVPKGTTIVSYGSRGGLTGDNNPFEDRWPKDWSALPKTGLPIESPPSLTRPKDRPARPAKDKAAAPGIRFES